MRSRAARSPAAGDVAGYMPGNDVEDEDNGVPESAT